jgi:uncharacterized protein with HEPN domain
MFLVLFAQFTNHDRGHIEIVGGVKNRHPEIPWSQVAAFRNVLAHTYLGIDLDIIWTVVQRAVPLLKHAVSAMQQEV